MNLDQTRYQGELFLLDNYSSYKFSGPDTSRFLQGQLTNDVNALEVGMGQLTCRLDRNGRLLGHAYLVRRESDYILFSVNDSIEQIATDIERFIIMDDVEVARFEAPIYLLTGALGIDYKLQKKFQIPFHGESSFVVFEKVEGLEISPPENISKLSNLTGTIDVPTLWANKLVNETRFNELGVSYNKGCFLGQETAAKIQTRKGPNYYPVLLKVISGKTPEILPERSSIQNGGKEIGKTIGLTVEKEQKYILAMAKREFRIEGQTTTVHLDDTELKVELIYLPLYRDISFEDKAKTLYYEGVELFQAERVEEAISKLKLAITFDAGFADAYETLGVIYGRVEKYKDALNIMDQLLEVDESSVMAHTNKSIFYMKMGNIEAAEDEKSRATIKSFAMHGEASKQKKLAEEQKEKEKKELAQRENMFKQVLEMDEEDEIANFGMGDISYRRKEYSESLSYLEKVMNVNPKNSNAYLISGKSFLALGDKVKARRTFEEGIEIAAKNGELMPANEMQRLMSKIN